MADGPGGLAVPGTLDWLFPSVRQDAPDFEVSRPLGVRPSFTATSTAAAKETGLTTSKVGDSSRESWTWAPGFMAPNADLLLDEDLVSDFAPVHLVKRQFKVKHADDVFSRLCDPVSMAAAGFSIRCLPSREPNQVLTSYANSLTLGHALPKRWLVIVYYEPARRPVVESALAQQGFPVDTMKEVACGGDETDQYLSFRHGCGRCGFWVQQGSDEIEVNNGPALDAEMKAWKQSYEAAPIRAIAGPV